MYKIDSSTVKTLPKENNFRLRGLETTRLDTFIDAAFAFATTMLVISVGNIPNNFNELILAFKTIPSFLASFASVTFIWLGHRKWSRRYGIENNFTILMSLGLVFVLLIYIYPLRLVFSALFTWISGGFLPSEFSISTINELSILFVVYGLGFAAISFLLGVLFLYAFKKKMLIHLNEIEILFTKYEFVSWFTMGSTALLSAFFAFAMPIKLSVFAGFVYILLPIVMPAISIHYGKKVEKILNKNQI
jgi:hypothetical protein